MKYSDLEIKDIHNFFMWLGFEECPTYKSLDIAKYEGNGFIKKDGFGFPFNIVFVHHDCIMLKSYMNKDGSILVTQIIKLKDSPLSDHYNKFKRLEKINTLEL